MLRNSKRVKADEKIKERTQEMIQPEGSLMSWSKTNTYNIAICVLSLMIHENTMSQSLCDLVKLSQHLGQLRLHIR